MKKKSSYKPVEVNKWNRKQWAYPAFMPDEYNKYELGGDTSDADFINNMKQQVYGSRSASEVMEDVNANASGGFGASFMKGAGDGLKFKSLSGLGSSLGTAIGSNISGIGSAVGGAIGGLIGNGYESGVGNALGSIGKIASVIPGPWGAAISGGLQILGGGVNALFGTKVDQAKLNAANKGTNALKSFKSGATSFDNIKLATAQANVQDAYSAGVFRKSWAEERNKEIKRQRAEAKSFADRSVANNVSNLAKNQISDAMANYSAFGGPIGGALDYNFMSDYLNVKQQRANQDNNSGLTNMLAYTPSTMFADGGSIHIAPSKKGTFTAAATKHGMGVQEFASHVLANKDDYSSTMVKKANFARNAKKFKHANGGKLNVLYDDKPVFAFGGDLQTNSADFSTGLTHISAGGSHEESPYDGVQVGVDGRGVPNLVEENEVIFDDYVYSARIPCDLQTKERFHISKKRDITYADLAKRLEKEIAERPNDPISRAGFKAQMADLADEQERQKQEMEAARAREAFEALSPEEQTALMQRAAQEEQVAQEQAANQQLAQEQAIAEQQSMQPTPEEAIAMEQQMPMEEGYAYGGNLFDEGGYKGALAWLRKKLPNAKNLEYTAKVLAKRAKAIGYHGSDTNNVIYDWDGAYDSMWARSDRKLGKANDKLFESLVADGMPREAAFEMAYPKELSGPYAGKRYGEEHTIARNQAYKKYVTDYKESASTTGNAPSNNKATAVNKEWRSLDGKTYKTEQEATAASMAYMKDQRSGAYAADKPQAQAQSQQAATVVEEPKVKGQSDKSSGTKAAKSATGSSQTINVGTLNTKVDNPWNEYGLPGLQEYLVGELADYNDANHTDEDRAKIRKRIADTINGIQQSYYDNIRPTLGQSTQKKSDAVGEHQRMYQEATNNRGFWDYDEEGRRYDKIDQAIDKPGGHNTSDTLAGGWVDKFSGPQTWLRHMGASGDGLDNIVSQLREVGIDYSPYNSWTIGEGDAAKQLYRASLIVDPSKEAGKPATTTEKSFAEEYPMIARPAEEPEKQMTVAERYGAPWAATTPAAETEAPVSAKDSRKVVPNLRNESYRYAGILGPAVGLGMQALGIGKPDTSGIDSAITTAYSSPALADYQPIGNYMTYKPMDTWFEQNAMNAQARATDRALVNSNSPSRAAGLLANGYNSQLASGDLYRKALEYNDAKKKQVEEFNRGTNMFNANAYNHVAQFNADAINRARQFGASMEMQGAREKMDADQWWASNLYGNVNNIFKGISDVGRENAEWNKLARLVAAGVFPGLDPDHVMNSGYTRWESAEGGLLDKKYRKKGLI